MLKLGVLIADLATSFALAGISYNLHAKEIHNTTNHSGILNASSDVSNAIGAVAVFGGGGLFYFLWVLIYYICKFIAGLEKSEQKSCIKSLLTNLCGKIRRCEISNIECTGVSIAFGGVCFYIGDNLPPMIRKYGRELNCNQGCVEVLQIFGIFMLGIATVTYIPVLVDSVHKARSHNNNKSDEVKPLLSNYEYTIPKEMTSAHAVVFLLLAKLTNLDLVYTAIERAASKQCNEKVKGGAWAYYVAYFIAFLGVCVYKIVYKYEYKKAGGNTAAHKSSTVQWNGTEQHYGSGEHTERNRTQKNTRRCKCTCTCTCILAVSNAILITAFAACYILADTRLPLACSAEIAETDPILDIVRLVLWGATVIFGVAVFFCWWWYTHMYKR